MSVTAAAKSKMLLDYMVSCIICILVPSVFVFQLVHREKKKPYLKWDVSNLYFPCFIRRRKQICFVGAAAPAQWQINSSSFDITVHIIISSTNGRGLTLCVLARATWQRAGTSLLPAEMLQEVSVERGWGSERGTGPHFPARGTARHGYKPPALGFPQPLGTDRVATPPLCRMGLEGMDGHGAGTAGTCQGLLTCGRITKCPGIMDQLPWNPLPGSSLPAAFPQGGNKNTPSTGPCWAHWKAQDKVCKPSLKQEFQGCKEVLSNMVGLGAAPLGIQVWDQLQSRSYSLKSTLSQARKRRSVL